MADTYTGQVSVAGPPDDRRLPRLSIRKVAVGQYDNNCYLLRCEATGELLLVDAANEAARLLREVEDLGGNLATILTTHRHFDHWQALEEVSRATGAAVLAHSEDAPELPVPVTATVGDGETVRVGAAGLTAIHLVGHTPGSLALLYDADGELADSPHLFTGDSLFPGGPGNTFGVRENFERLMDDLERKVFGPLPDPTWVYPGHGGDTTLGRERPSVPEWRARGW